MAVSMIGATHHFQCLSSDSKPTTDIIIGSRLFETDTGATFRFDGSAWKKETSAAVDNSTYARTTIDYPHHEIHGGSAYTLSYPITIPGANEVEIRIAVAATTKWPHMVWSFTNDAAFTVDVFEVTTKAHEAGNVLTPINRNRNSANTSGLTICHTPSGSGDGNVIWSFAGGANKTVTTAENRNEFILDQGVAYLVNLSGASGDVAHLLFDWYEHTDKE